MTYMVLKSAAGGWRDVKMCIQEVAQQDLYKRFLLKTECSICVKLDGNIATCFAKQVMVKSCSDGSD